MRAHKIKTKFGNASISAGYYRITSQKEGNLGKLLHRLIFEDFYKIKLPKGIVIHHEDGDKLNNNIWNLVPMTVSEHISLHGKNISDETREKISQSKIGPKNPMYGKKLSEKQKENLRWYAKHQVVSDETREKLRLANLGPKNPMYGKDVELETRKKISKVHGSSGFFRVTKSPCASCNQGYTWRYRYTDKEGKRHSFISTSLKKLEDKVVANDLEWIILDEDLAEISLCESVKNNHEDNIVTLDQFS